MWTTADGYTLRLSGARLASLLPRLSELGLRSLVQKFHNGDTRQAAMRAFRELSGNAFRTGTLRRRSTGTPLLVFTAEVGGRVYRLVARPAGRARAEIVSVRGQSAGAEYSDGHGHREVQSAIVRALMEQGLRKAITRGAGRDHPDAVGVYRDNQDQVRSRAVRNTTNPAVTDSGNIPDVSYPATDGFRVNVEIDDNPNRTIARRSSLDHLQRLIDSDPRSRHIGFVVHPVTGAILERREYVPPPPSQQNITPGRADALPVLYGPQATLALPAPDVPRGLIRAPVPPRPIATFLPHATNAPPTTRLLRTSPLLTRANRRPWVLRRPTRPLSVRRGVRQPPPRGNREFEAELEALGY